MNNIKSISIAFSLLFLAACGKNEEQAPPAVAQLPVVEVPLKSLTVYQEFPASLEGINNNEVRAKIQGYIRELYVDEGQYVSKGQALFRLETDVLTQDAGAARAGVSASSAAVEAAQANVSAAQVEVDKLIPLVEKNIISNIQLETAKAGLAQAKAQLSQAKAAYKQSQAGLGSVQANIDFSVVRSPINGFVGSLPFRLGSLVGPNDLTPLTTVSDNSQIYAYFSMNEKEYLDFLEKAEGKNITEKLKNIPPVELVLANGAAYPEKGKIETVTGQINPNTGTIEFRARFLNASRLLSNGNSGKIRIPQSLADVVVIPESATFERQGNIYYFQVKQDTAYLNIVKVKDRTNNMIIVDSGVKQGDKIVAEGASTLKDKTAIKPQIIPFDSIVSTIPTVF